MNKNKAGNKANRLRLATRLGNPLKFSLGLINGPTSLFKGCPDKYIKIPQISTTQTIKIIPANKYKKVFSFIRTMSHFLSLPKNE